MDKDIKSYKIRLLPTKEQEVLLRLHVDAMRFTWNWGLATNIDRYINGEKYQGKSGNGTLLTQLKRNDGRFAWLKKVSAQMPSQALRDLEEAYNRFFKTQETGPKYTRKKLSKFARKGKPLTPYEKNGHPKFKSRETAEEKFYVRNDMYILEDTVNLEKIGKVRYQTTKKFHKTFPKASRKSENTTKFINPRVKHTNGKWILSFGIERDPGSAKPVLSNITVGIDLGITTLATCSDGLCIPNVNRAKRVRKLEKRLRQQQRAYNRKTEAHKKHLKKTEALSKRRLKNKIKVAKLHRKLANIRLDHVHKATAGITDRLPKTIVIEDLKVSEMIEKDRKTSRAIQNCLWGEFRRQLEYKCRWKGIELVVANQFYPSSKLCSGCGWKKVDLKRHERTFRCNVCGLVIDRDVNASYNLKKLAV